MALRASLAGSQYGPTTRTFLGVIRMTELHQQGVVISRDGTAQSRLMAKIADRSACISVVGLGYVGLPLAVEFARAGFCVTGIDLNVAKCTALNAGRSYVADVPSEVVSQLVASHHLVAAADYALLAESDVVIICVPTPLGKSKDPDISYILAAADALAPTMHVGMLVVLESTTYPGTTEEVLLPRIRQNGYVMGQDIFLAFSPERVDPGNQQYHTRNTPKVVGGMTPACLEVASALYATAVDHVVPVSSPATAEMVKILENTFRAVNIGLVNELAMICQRLGIDIWEVVAAAATKPFGFTPFYPGPGLGGHCIPIDPLYLTWKMRGLGLQTRFIELADAVNSNMPHYVVGRIQDALNEEGKPLRGARILVLGVTYKKDVDDLRESPALVIIEELRQRHADVTYNDPFIPALSLGTDITFRSVELSDALLGWADCVLIHTAHSTYDWSWVGQYAHLVFDTRGVMPAPACSRLVRL
jgi:UDP-N-acetyl-D-glucosamine dehydrogenase